MAIVTEKSETILHTRPLSRAYDRFSEHVIETFKSGRHIRATPFAIHWFRIRLAAHDFPTSGVCAVLTPLLECLEVIHALLGGEMSNAALSNAT